jgi:hypothetical protein
VPWNCLTARHPPRTRARPSPLHGKSMGPHC